MKMHEVAGDYCIQLYIHYNGVIIGLFATKKPRREQTIMIGGRAKMSQISNLTAVENKLQCC